MAERDQELSGAELEVLKILWEHAPATVRDVLNRLHDRGRTLAYTTVLTFLNRLEQKGFVTSDKDGVAYRYTPTVSRENVTHSRLRTLLDELFDGAAAPLVLQLVRETKLEADDLSALRDLIDRLDKDSPVPPSIRKGRSRD